MGLARSLSLVLALCAAPAFASLVVALCAAPALAQGVSNPLVRAPDEPAPDLDRASLDTSLPVRQTCRELVRVINEQGELWQLVREGVRDREDFRADQRRLDEKWRSARSRCDLGIVGLPRGWPRDVLDYELQLIDSLQSALTGIVTAYLEERPVPEINAGIEAYEQALGTWTDSLQNSSDFWSGAWLSEARDHSCLGDLRESARGVSKGLWRLITQPREQRAEQDLVVLKAMLDGLRAAHGACATTATGPAARVEHALVGELLGCYERCYQGIRDGDDDTIRAAMDQEQLFTSRLVRCRQEHAAGAPTGPCRAP